MTSWKRTLSWVSATLVGVVLVGSGVYLAVTDLDRADKLASVAGAVIGVTGLGLSLYGTVLARRARRASISSGGQTLTRVDARGGIDIVHTAAGSVRLGVAQQPPSGSVGKAAVPGAHAASGEQSVQDVRSGGHIRIIRDVGGDVDSIS
jgi:hypothetical protein